MSGTPEEVFRQGLELLLANDMDGFVDLFAEDGTSEFPFAEAGSPTRLDGREEVRRYMKGISQAAKYEEIPFVTVHRTQDPDVIVVEFGAIGRAVRTGERFEMSYVAVITVRDGRIVSYRDYWSPVVVAEAMGELPALISALEERARG